MDRRGYQSLDAAIVFLVGKSVEDEPEAKRGETIAAVMVHYNYSYRLFNFIMTDRPMDY